MFCSRSADDFTKQNWIKRERGLMRESKMKNETTPWLCGYVMEQKNNQLSVNHHCSGGPERFLKICLFISAHLVGQHPLIVTLFLLAPNKVVHLFMGLFFIIEYIRNRNMEISCLWSSLVTENPSVSMSHNQPVTSSSDFIPQCLISFLGWAL